MKSENWKIIAIIFIVLFLVETSFFIFSIAVAKIENNKIKNCYYEICEDYPEAELIDDICYCYDYDLLGQPVLAKEKWIK